MKEEKHPIVLYKEEENLMNKNEWLAEQMDNFKCVCGLQDNLYNDSTLVKCEKCGVVQHAECILYNPELAYDEYKCPYCWISNKVILHLIKY